MSGQKIGLFYGSDTGNTQRVAEMLCSELSQFQINPIDIEDCSVEDMMSFDVLILGVSTWDIGQIQCSWEDKLDELASQDFGQRQVAIFGLGDSVGYPDTFVDGMGILWESLGKERPGLIGVWPTEGYDFDDSRGRLDDDHFLGMVIDEDSEPEHTEKRVRDWGVQLTRELAEILGNSEAA